MNAMFVSAVLALSASQANAFGWFGAARGGWASTGTSIASAKGPAPVPSSWGWGASWNTKPVTGGWGGWAQPAANNWGGCAQGQWPWRVGCKAIPECGAGQVWKGWAGGCCKNDCGAGQTWDFRTNKCCAVPSCPAGQAWKGWVRGCCADNTVNKAAGSGSSQAVAFVSDAAVQDDVVADGDFKPLVDDASNDPEPAAAAPAAAAPAPVPAAEPADDVIIEGAADDAVVEDAADDVALQAGDDVAEAFADGAQDDAQTAPLVDALPATAAAPTAAAPAVMDESVEASGDDLEAEGNLEGDVEGEGEEGAAPLSEGDDVTGDVVV